MSVPLSKSHRKTKWFINQVRDKLFQLTSSHFADKTEFCITREVIPLSASSTVHGAFFGPSFAAIVGFTTGPIEIFNAAPDQDYKTGQYFVISYMNK